ncbi:MAG: hypothetical protein RL591_988, partial [Planctomycetota bacterium]
FTPRGAGQSEQVAKQVASAQSLRGRRCGGDLWRGLHQSERKRALKHGCPMSRGVSAASAESHRNRGRSSFASSVDLSFVRCANDVGRHPFRWLSISLRSINRHRAPVPSRSPLRRRPLAWSPPKRASCEAGCECSKTSAEQNEAREDDARFWPTFRVASPLVMARRKSRADVQLWNWL